MQKRIESHCSVHSIPNTVVWDKENREENRTLAFNYLKNNKVDLVKGDIIVYNSFAGYRNEGVEIFDGDHIIPLAYDLDEYGSLPKNFHVIEHNVPIKYWFMNINNSDVIGIDNNNIVWFDHSLVRDECIRNIKYELVTSKWTIYTTFIFNNTQYTIILADYIDDNKYDDYNSDTYELGLNDRNDCIQRFTKLLQQNEIVFENESEFFDESDNTLYITTWNAMKDNLL